MINFYLKKATKRLCLLLFCCSMSFVGNAQVTPPNANTDAECGADCWDIFDWSRVQDGSGTNIPNFAEGVANDANCNTIINAAVEYEGPDSSPDLTGIILGANLQGNSTWVDSWTLTFGEALTDPVINITALFSDSEVTIKDCAGNAISLTDISSGTVVPTGVFMGNDQVQLSGTYDCIILTVSNDRSDSYEFTIGTCLGADPLPPCVDCGMDDFKYLRLVNKSGSGTGTIADVELDNILIGTAEVLFSDLDVNEDLAGAAFGAFDNDGGVFLLKIELCEEIVIQQVDVLGLETESQVWVGNSLSGSGMTGIPEGFTLTQCGGANTMAPTGNMVTNTAASCANQGSGKYTVGGVTTDVLYFRYTNPTGGCTFDKATFRIGSCVSDGADAVPVCPLEYLTYATDIEDYVTNGPDFVGNDANAFRVMRDVNGNFFNQNCAQIENDVTNGTTIPTTAISPCAEIVEVEECSFCTPPVPCVECPIGTENKFISLDKTGETNGGLDKGLVEIDGVCVGQYEFVFDDLDVNTDGNGTTFGGFDVDGGTMILQMDFCDPLMVNQLDVRGLEVMSEVSVGTTISGMGASAVLGGQTLTFCDGSSRMGVGPAPNEVITDGPGCLANPNASYTFGTNPVSTLYFKYHNPDAGCRYDYVGFRIATCVSPPPMALPVCPFEEVVVTCDMDAVIANGGVTNNANSDTYVVDGAGNYFDFTNCNATTLINAYENGTPLQTVNIGCADLVSVVEECIPDGCTIEPTCATTMCPDDTEFGYINLDQDGTNTANLPMGTVELDNVKIGTYEFVFSDLDLSEDGNGTTFGGWDNDGGTMLLMLEFCEPLIIQELDIRGLEVGSQVSVGTTTSSMDASAMLSGLDLNFCAGSDRMTLNDGANNLVITDGPGCLANPNATYTVSSAGVTSFYFKYFNPPSDGTFPSRCRGDYVGFKIGACIAPPVMAMPTCPLNLFTVDDCPDDPNNATTDYYQDANGNWFPDNICTDPVDEMTMVETINISPCATTTFVELCAFCCELEVTCPPTDLGMITCNDAVPTAATTEAEFEALGGDIADDPGFCGDLVITHEDVYDPPMDICDGRTMTRTYTITDDMDEEFTCTQTLMISAPTGPTITCPADMTVECFSDIAPVSDNATVTTDCSQGFTTVISGPVQVGDDDCPMTTYTYTYTVTDDCGRTASCEQIFTIENAAPVVVAPADATVTCFADIAVDADDAVVTVSCTLGATTTVNGPVQNGSANCPGSTYTYTYRTVDACGRIAEDEQVFTIGENDAPTITAPADYEVTCLGGSTPNPAWATFTTACDNGVAAEVTVSGPVISGALDCPGTTYTYTYTVVDACGRSASDTQTLTVMNEGPQLNCPAPLQVFGCLEGGYNDKIEAWIETVDATSSCGTDLTVNNNFNGNAGICLGNNFTTVTFSTVDACGRFASCQGTIVITDTDAPIIYAEPQDLLVPCTGNTQQIFNDWLAIQGGAQATDGCWGDQINWSASVGPNALNCSNGPQAIVVTFTAFDGCGNSATTIGIFNTKLLPNQINVSGLIQREDSAPVAGVQVGAYLGGGLPEMDMSNDGGDYAFPELAFDEDTEIKPEKNDDPLNGVSTYDLVVMQQHILGINELNSPYLRIAADINRSGNISTLDLVLLRKLILQIDEEFTDNTSWRFVDADFVFPNPQNPFASEFPEIYSVAGQEDEVADFIAVKIGDLNLDGDTYSFNDNEVDDRSGLEELTFEIEDQELIAGEEYRIDVSAQNFGRINGFQFTLNASESVKVLAIESGDLLNFNAQNYNLTKLDQGAIPMSWNTNAMQDLHSEDVAFSVIIKANSAVKLSEAISITSQFTKAEAYQSGELMNVNLAFNTNGAITQVEEFRLFQNQPNPFKGATNISFNLPKASEVNVVIYDLSGRQLFSETGAFAKGFNQINLDRADLPSGVLYYQVSTATDSDSKKMIVID